MRAFDARQIFQIIETCLDQFRGVDHCSLDTTNTLDVGL